MVAKISRHLVSCHGMSPRHQKRDPPQPQRGSFYIGGSESTPQILIIARKFPKAIVTIQLVANQVELVLWMHPTRGPDSVEGSMQSLHKFHDRQRQAETLYTAQAQSQTKSYRPSTKVCKLLTNLMSLG